MCDFFWQRMENDQGDLADIVRAGGRGSALSSEFPNTSWQLPSEPITFPPPSTEGKAVCDFGDPFAGLRDPLLDQLIGSEFFDGPSTTSGLVSMISEGGGGGGDGGGSSGLGAQNMMTSAEMRRPCNMFSRVLQISPGTGRTSPLSPRVIKPSPVVAGGMIKVADGSLGCPVDPSIRVQISSPRTPGIKRRKSLAKKVVCIPAPAATSSRSSGEVVPSDLWAWRKYGQKPIKGSPYPRGYYRCSSSKGCSARKQVERSRTDPNMLVITYTSEHNHPWPTQRNALAGSSRSQSSKNSSSGSKNSPHKRKPPTSHGEESKVMTSSSAPAVKGEAREMGKAIDSVENNEFDQLFQQSYKSMIPESNQPNDFFADLAELEPDPMSLIFSKGSMETKPDEERGERALDPFNFFDWTGNSFEEAKKGL
ncbi:probable WRKY transcription factor 14 [Elaeis guineensis]|uniref:Probable WRKY transcription factor 14 n=1 Tax=Elaeis guineensis var. tenera TaxID=51953 RepID=A0A6I9RW59_ELAGV|nr:probable WRKY transcription factor 14 [Elaeis guineensis]